jgi:hypothetical protein
VTAGELASPPRPPTDERFNSMTGDGAGSLTQQLAGVVLPAASPLQAASQAGRNSAAEATAAVAAAVAAAASAGGRLGSSSGRRTSTAVATAGSLAPAAAPAAASPAAVRRLSSEGAAASPAALAVGRPASPGERRAALLAELQDRLVKLAVEKAALEQELHTGRGQLQQLQHKVSVGAACCAHACQETSRDVCLSVGYGNMQ